MSNGFIQLDGTFTPVMSGATHERTCEINRTTLCKELAGGVIRVMERSCDYIALESGLTPNNNQMRAISRILREADYYYIVIEFKGRYQSKSLTSSPIRIGHFRRMIG